MDNKKLVIFDFDGVIANTHDISFALNQKTNPHLTEELYSQMSHGNFYASFESENPIITFNPNPTFAEEYGKSILEIDIPPVLKEVIISLSSKYMLAICSSAFGPTIEAYLEKEGILNCFDSIFGAEIHKSKVVKLKQLLEKYKVEKESAVFITDTLGDVLEAHEVGIKSIAETWGLHTRETLEKGKPEIIIENPEDLEKVISSILD
ncbi:MAG: HAD family hydrolase [Candidatus Pacebacteria bacterium]|nr:HAD family hydrolase [Candidatus Paceibacterota bacterium]